MVSSTLVKLSSPVAKSCLVALSVALLINAIFLIYTSRQYPYLTDNYDDYIENSRPIAIVYSCIALTAILISVSTAVASYKNTTNYVLLHTGITGVFLPVLILVYFTLSSARYKIDESIDAHKLIAEYKISSSHRRIKGQDIHESTTESNLRPKTMLKSITCLIDSIQTKFSCCGVESMHDWMKEWDNYIAPSCCKEPSSANNIQWATRFKVDPDHSFEHCTEASSYHRGCRIALKEEEQSKYAWLSDLVVFMMVITIANTIVSLLLFGLSKTEDTSSDVDEHELSMVGVSSKSRPSQPTITSIKHRPSVVHTLGASTENITARAQAVRFNISNSPRTSISGPSKFSAAARRGSSFI